MNKKIKILIVILIILVLLFALFYFLKKDNKQEVPKQNIVPKIEQKEPKKLTEQEQIDLLNDLQKEGSKDEIPAEKQIEILDSLKKEPELLNKENGEENKVFSQDEQIKILESLQK